MRIFSEASSYCWFRQIYYPEHSLDQRKKKHGLYSSPSILSCSLHKITFNAIQYIESHVCLLHVPWDKSITVKHPLKGIKDISPWCSYSVPACVSVRTEEVKRWRGGCGEYLWRTWRARGPSCQRPWRWRLLRPHWERDAARKQQKTNKTLVFEQLQLENPDQSKMQPDP